VGGGGGSKAWGARGGGSIWGDGSLRPGDFLNLDVLGLVGNPGPTGTPTRGPGGTKLFHRWSSLALKSDTAPLAWHYQFRPARRSFDYDATQGDAGGSGRKKKKNPPWNGTGAPGAQSEIWAKPQMASVVGPSTVRPGEVSCREAVSGRVKLRPKGFDREGRPKARAQADAGGGTLVYYRNNQGADPNWYSVVLARATGRLTPEGLG